MFKVGLISGHGAGDVGAVGNGYREADLTIEVVKALDVALRSRGIETKVYPYERNAFKDGRLVVDFSDCDYVLEIHFNSFNGSAHGTEIYVTTSEVGVSVEEKIVSNISAIGFYNRGVKRYNYNVISAVKKLGVSSALLEVCFIDNASNMNLFLNNRDAVINAIVNGIVEGFGIGQSESIPVVESVPVVNTYDINDVVNDVIAGKFGNGHDARREGVEALGFNYDEVRALVNARYGVNPTSKPVTSGNGLTKRDVAMKIIRGEFGNGHAERRKRVEALGFNYDEIRKLVNELM